MLTRLSRYHTLEAYHRVLAWNNNHNDNNNNNTKALESLLERLCRIMKQQSLTDGFEKFRNKTRKEKFLDDMEVIILW